MFKTVCLFLLALAAALPARAAETVYRSGRLDNGLAYHIFHVPSAGHRLVMRLNIAAGAADEEAGEEGIAHITEHMVFQSSPEYPQGLSAALSRTGWQMGRHFNAQTGYGHTRFLLTPPQGVKQLREALKIYRRILSPQQFSAADWEKERQVVLAEWQQQQGLQARLARRQQSLLYGTARQGRYAPIGRREALLKADTGTASRFHAKWYGSNNAVVTIVGGADPAETEKLLAQELGALRPVSLPQRNPAEYAPTLQDKRQLALIQDADNADGKTALVFRWKKLQTASEAEAAYERLLDNFAAYILNLRVHESDPDIAFRLDTLGGGVLAPGFYTDSAPGRHHEALQTLEALRRDILDQPASDSETAAYRKAVHGSLMPEAEGDFPDNFSKTAAMADEMLDNGLPLPDKRTKALNRSQLYRIGSQAVNRRIAQWLNAPDQMVLVQTVAGQPAAMPSENPPAPASDKGIAQPVFAEPAGGGITAERYDPKLDIRYLTLSNGDTAVILKTPLAGANVYFKAVSKTGYLETPSDPWKTLLAAETAARAAPSGMSAARFKRWLRDMRIQYRYRIDGYRQTADAQAPAAAFVPMLQLYRHYQTEPDLGAWQSAVERESARHAVHRRSKNGQMRRLSEIMQYGRSITMPSENSAYAAIDRAALEARSRMLLSAPSTYYIAANLPAQEIKNAVTRYLASVPRTPRLPTAFPQPGGAKMQQAPVNDTEGTEISAKSWQSAPALPPEIFEQIPLLENLANARLKDELRGIRQSAYGVRFTATPDFGQKEIAATLTVHTAAGAAAESWQTARRILSTLPDHISYADARNLRRLFVEEENRRRSDPKLWLERLAASHSYYGDARYLENSAGFADGISRSSLRETARLLWSADNEQVLLMTPRQ